MTKERKAKKGPKVTFMDPVADIPPLGVTINGHKNAVPSKIKQVTLERSIRKLYQEMVDIETKIAALNFQNELLKKAKQESNKN